MGDPERTELCETEQIDITTLGGKLTNLRER